jgi:predicted transposase YdaD
MHDQLWKEMLGFFLPGSLALLQPRVALDIDLGHIRSLNKELYTHGPWGRRREPDVLAVAPWKSGLGSTLVHLEVQARRSSDFPRRMWEYFMMLTLREKTLVLPLALYLCHGDGITEEGHDVLLHGKTVNVFRYTAIYLPDLWEEDYWDEGNVISPAICSVMRSRTCRNLERRVRAYERIASAPVDEERRSVLLNMVDQYLCLNDRETEEWNMWMEKERSKEVRRMLTQWHVKGIEEGKALGKAEGKAEGKRETLLRQMRVKFGPIPESVETQIKGINNPEILDEIADRVLFANSLEEMKLGFL